MIAITIVIVIVLGGGELFARCYLGLGTPPLSVAHPTIEYMFKPNQDLYRFGNHVVINQYGMRSPPFGAHAATGETRIMVFGDSVLNGGNHTDQEALATTIVQRRLADQAKHKIIVGNISANSWGPGNWLAYAKTYGFFNSDVVALVISSHDYADNPTFQPLDEITHPSRLPVSALTEAIAKYLPRYLSSLGVATRHGKSGRPSERLTENNTQKGLQDLKNFLLLAKSSSPHVLVFQHWDQEEIESGNAKPGNTRIREICLSLGLSPVQLKPYFEQSLQQGINPYQDILHPNQRGQQLIAEALLDNLPDEVLQPR